ncbi:cell surface protein [Corynebacterium renale]|nr:cell surface protein [Corynebacterium renale]
MDNGATDAARNEPTYPAEKVMTSEVTTIPMTAKVPANTTFEMANTGGLKATVNKQTGELQVTPPHNAPPQATYTVQVKVTYPDQSTEIVSISVTTNSQANENDAHWNDVVAPRGAVVVAKQTALLPEGAAYAIDASFAQADWEVSIDSATGDITVKNHKAATGTNVQIPVVVTYKDGSQERETVTVRAVDNAAATEKVVYPPLTLDAGRSATLTPNQVEGATFTLVENQPGLTTTIDAATGVITVTADANTVGGPRTIPVGVQFADGSTTTVNATVTVNEGDAPIRDPWESVAPNSSGKNSTNGWIALVVGILGAIGGLAMLIFNNRDVLARFGIHF